jgi:hypothetical protein
MDFVTVDDADKVEELIKGVVRGKELPFPEARKDPCDGFLTPGCPIKKGQNYRFKASFQVKPFYPAVSTPLSVEHSIVMIGDRLL